MLSCQLARWLPVTRSWEAIVPPEFKVKTLPNLATSDIKPKGEAIISSRPTPPPVTQICTNALMSAGQCQIHQLVRGETLETMLLVWSPMQGGIYRFSQSVSETWYSSKDSSHAQSTFTLMDCRTLHETLRLVNTNMTQLSSLSGTWLSEQLFRILHICIYQSLKAM